MIKKKLTAGSAYISPEEAQAVEQLTRILASEDGYIIPIYFIGKKIVNREVDALLLLPDAIFLLDFKNWSGQHVEVEGLNNAVRCLRRGAWTEEHNSLLNYEYASRELATRLGSESWLKPRPHIYSLMVFTAIGFTDAPQIAFAGGDPKRPQPVDGVCACRIEQVPQVIAAFRAASATMAQLNQTQLKTLAEVLLQSVKAPAKARQRRIAGYLFQEKHYDDTFLGCTIYQGESEPLKEPVWIKEYEQVLASADQRTQKEQLVLRHADVLRRFPQHANIVAYRAAQTTSSHLYIILERKPGIFLSELLGENPADPLAVVDIPRSMFDLQVRLRMLGDLLSALEYLTQQRDLKYMAYRDLRPESIFVQYTDAMPVAQLFNFDCTKIPGAVTKMSHIKKGQKRFPLWDDYAAPELLEYIEMSQSSPDSGSFAGDVRSDLFSWGIIAWEMLTGTLPFVDIAAKLEGNAQPWPASLDPQIQTGGDTLAPTAIQLIQACLELAPDRRPSLATLRHAFP